MTVLSTSKTHFSLLLHLVIMQIRKGLVEVVARLYLRKGLRLRPLLTRTIDCDLPTKSAPSQATKLLAHHL